MEKVIRHLEEIFDIMSDGIYITDSEGVTLWVNTHYEQLTGLKRQDILGRNVSDLVAEGIFDTVLNPTVVATRHASISVQHVHGHTKVVLRGVPVFDTKGEVALVVTFIRDISMIAEFRDQISQQKELIESYSQHLENLMGDHTRFSEPIFESSAMKDTVALAKRVASTDATMLILGETGVGKDVLASLTHEYSPRAKKIFMKVDCSSIAENLIESELFGYVAGAFSGASTKGKVGYFELANGGTVFLDEVGELPLAMQAKLLRVLQDKEVMRVGDAKARKVDVRIIAATNRDLALEVASGRFRSDLFYRLNVAVINVPPLRERQEDILPLAHRFLSRFCVKYHRQVTFLQTTCNIFQNYRWPGNVREMQNLIQSLVVISSGAHIRPSHLPNHMQGTRLARTVYTPPSPDDTRPLKDIMAEIEREILENAVRTHGSLSHVAKMYKISRTTLFRKLRDSQSLEGVE
ncbi:MAG: sigma 54-interacting transcriptional regulator [Pseudomonadota bacterium]